jgi:hypothetical protein
MAGDQVGAVAVARVALEQRLDQVADLREHAIISVNDLKQNKYHLL